MAKKQADKEKPVETVVEEEPEPSTEKTIDEKSKYEKYRQDPLTLKKGDFCIYGGRLRKVLSAPKDVKGKKVISLNKIKGDIPLDKVTTLVTVYADKGK